MEIPGIGEKMVDKIYQAVNRFYEGGRSAQRLRQRGKTPAEGSARLTKQPRPRKQKSIDMPRLRAEQMPERERRLKRLGNAAETEEATPKSDSEKNPPRKSSLVRRLASTEARNVRRVSRKRKVPNEA